MTKKIFVVFMGFLFFVGCDRTEEINSTNQKPIVYTTFYPTLYFTEQIAGGLVDVVCPVPEDEDAIFWEAYKYPEIIQKYQEADLIVLNGAGFAKWVEKVSLPQDKMVDTAKPFEKDFIVTEGETHSHGNQGTHSHAGLDGHTWVDPVNAIVQAQEIKKALLKLFPEHQQKLEDNYQKLEKQLNELVEILANYGKSVNARQPLLASHPAYNYIARRFSWNIKSLDLDPEEMISEEQINEIKELLKNHTAKYLIWESMPLPETVEKLQHETGLESIEFSPCELLSTEDKQKNIDYLTVMRNNLNNIKKIWNQN